MEQTSLNVKTNLYYIPFGGAFRNTIAAVIFSGIAFLVAIVAFSAEYLFWLWAIVALIALCLFFMPTLIAVDVSGRVVEIKGIEEFKGVKISHPYFWIIFLINLIFGATFLGWVIAFCWAHSPGNITLPTNVLNYINRVPSAPEIAIRDSGNNLDQLKEIDSLFESGKINESEKQKMRDKVLRID